MTDETENPQSIETLPEIPAVGDSTTSSPAPSEPEPVIAPNPILAEPIPTETWKQELREIVTLSEDELHRIVEWAKSKI